MPEIKRVADMIEVTSEWYYIIVPVVIMGLDILTGFLNAWRDKQIQSSKLRSGLTKKFGEMVIIIIAIFFQYTIRLPEEIVLFIVIYVVGMELISIAENLTKMGIKVPSWITKRLAAVVDDADESEEKDVKKD